LRGQSADESSAASVAPARLAEKSYWRYALPTVAPYGEWRSPITAEQVGDAGVQLTALKVSSGFAWWLESRPAEGGRSVVVRRDTAGHGGAVDGFGPDWNARSLVHEYGGGAYLVHGATAWFSNYEDQRLYRVEPGGVPEPVTPEPARERGLRYADGVVSPDGAWIVCVRESHEDDGEPVNEIVALPTDGSAPPRVVATGHDFYAAPRLSPDGTKLAWFSWDHPRMPWEGSELWTADFADGVAGEPRLVAGSGTESVIEPAWSADSVLHFVSERTGWWNPYRLLDGTIEALLNVNAEIGGPQWRFGPSSYVILPDGLAVIERRDGTDRLLVADRAGAVREVPTGFTVLRSLCALPGQPETVYLIGASPVHPGVVAKVDLATGATEVLAQSGTGERPDPGYVSVPRHIEFPTAHGLTAHAFYYPPTNKDFVAPEDELPPLVVFVHGGPTHAATAEFSLEVQYFTSRGLAVVDVNHGGSTGYGKAYRERLRGAWGVVDIEDCANAAMFLAETGRADRARMAVRGTSAGGYVTMCELTFRSEFACGAATSGVSDLEALAKETHKFEAHLTDGLVGPYPETRQRYRERSPLHFAGGDTAPVIFFQGQEDLICPPPQTEMMVEALAANGVPHAYLSFPGEQHGIRRSENITRCREAELAFYGYVMGFTPTDPMEPLEIHTASGTVRTPEAGR
jgi:dipeptidyl aminopeptidase/acylaminoacyl peptidase